jgi:hypothetical protein
LLDPTDCPGSLQRRPILVEKKEDDATVGEEPATWLHVRVLIYLLTPWSRVLLEKLTSELCS